MNNFDSPSSLNPLRNLRGTEGKKFYRDVAFLKSAESYMLSASATNVAYVSNPKGTITILPTNNMSARPTNGMKNKLLAHIDGITDLAHSPFHDDLLASTSSGGEIAVSKIFTNEGQDDTTEASGIIAWKQARAHGKKISKIAWNPVAPHVLATSGADAVIRAWDLDTGSNQFSITHSTPLWSGAWTPDGKYFYGIDSDQCLTLFDIRQNSIAARGTPIFSSTRFSIGEIICSRGSIDPLNVITIGADEMGKRCAKVFDIRDLTQCLNIAKIGGSGSLTSIHYDYHTSVLFASARGDNRCVVLNVENGNIYQLEDHMYEKQAMHTAFVPSRAVNVVNKELARCYHLHSDNATIKYSSFNVGKKGTDSSINPAVWSTYHSGRMNSTASYWFNGGSIFPDIATFTAVDGPQICLPDALETTVLTWVGKTPQRLVNIGPVDEDSYSPAEHEKEIAALRKAAGTPTNPQKESEIEHLGSIDDAMKPPASPLQPLASATPADLGVSPAAIIHDNNAQNDHSSRYCEISYASPTGIHDGNFATTFEPVNTEDGGATVRRPFCCWKC